jgi:hypothetical protein
MELKAGRVRQMVDEAKAAQSAIVCHKTLDGDNAVCRGFYDRFPTQPLQIAAAMGIRSSGGALGRLSSPAWRSWDRQFSGGHMFRRGLATTPLENAPSGPFTSTPTAEHEAASLELAVYADEGDE